MGCKKLANIKNKKKRDAIRSIKLLIIVVFHNYNYGEKYMSELFTEEEYGKLLNIKKKRENKKLNSLPYRGLRGRNNKKLKKFQG